MGAGGKTLDLATNNQVEVAAAPHEDGELDAGGPGIQDQNGFRHKSDRDLRRSPGMSDELHDGDGGKSRADVIGAASEHDWDARAENYAGRVSTGEILQ